MLYTGDTLEAGARRRGLAAEPMTCPPNAFQTGEDLRVLEPGESWSVASRGMFAAYTPPEQAENPVIQDPHRIVRCAGSPDVLWAQHHNGVFRSTDGAKSWKEIKINPSSFDGRTLAMGSTTGALWLSGDAGDSWTAASQDLPPVYCVRFGA